MIDPPRTSTYKRPFNHEGNYLVYYLLLEQNDPDTVADPGGPQGHGPPGLNFAPFVYENMYQTRPLAPRPQK